MEKSKKIFIVVALIAVLAIVFFYFFAKDYDRFTETKAKAPKSIEEVNTNDSSVKDVEDSSEEIEAVKPIEIPKSENVEIEYIDMGVTNNIDLDGDGDTEEITFYLTPLDEFDDYLTSFDLMIDDCGTVDIIDANDELVDMDFCGFYDKKLAIVSVPAFTEKLIVLSDFGPSDDYYSEMFMFKEGKIRHLGGTEGMLDTGSLLIENDGTIFSHSRSQYMQTWFYVCECIIHRNELVSIHRNFYPISTFSFMPDVQYKSTTLVDYDFFAEPYSWSGRINLPAGTEVNFTGTSETGWVEFEAGGSNYYVFMTGFNNIDGNENFTSDMLFDNLIFGD